MRQVNLLIKMCIINKLDLMLRSFYRKICTDRSTKRRQYDCEPSSEDIKFLQ